MSLEDWLDDLCVRFIINLPREDLSSVARICFQIEEAQWFYEDFIRPLDPALPSMSLRTFSLKMFQHCPLLASFSADAHLKAFEEFIQYKTRVPVRGAVMLNDAMDAAVLVRGYKKGASWSFPRGKINKDEDDVDCAIREVYEETGYDLRAAGLVEKNAPVYPLEVTMHDQQVRLYVFRGIPENTIFETRTRKEIGDIKWYKLSDLPAFRKKKGTGKNQGPGTSSQERFYMVAPFMVQLRQWVLKQKKVDVQNTPTYAGYQHPPAFYDENLTDDNMLHEPPPPPTSSSAHPENINSATRELHRLLQIKPPTQGLQLPSQTSNQQAGQALLSILQPKTANTGFTSSQRHSQPHESHDQEIQNVPHPSTLHHHNQVQVIPMSNSSVPSSFPINPNAGPSHHQQYLHHRPRPQVFITNDIPQPPQKIDNPPPQLLHPQPLPPQVQKEMLLRDLRDSASSPNVVGVANQPAPPSVSRGFRPVPASTQNQSHPHRGVDGRVKHEPQLAPHSVNLLNVLKGDHLPVSAAPQSASHPSPLNGNMPVQTEGHHQGQRIPVPEAGFRGQYGGAALPPTTFPATTMNVPAPFSRDNNRPIAPTDQHRASLLGMFKTGPSTISQDQVDGQGASLLPTAPRTNKTESPKQQRARPGPSTADVLKAAARENGQPLQWNPELNLPYGAHSILRRGPSRGSARSPALSTRNSNEAVTHLPVRSHPSPASSRGQMSPRRHMSPRSQMSPYQSYLNTRVHSPKQAVAQAQKHTTTSYPYGSSQGSASNPLAQLQGSPSASTLPTPGTIKPRQNSTVEHRNTLLSILGKPQPEAEQGMGKDTMGSEYMATGPGSMPRSRLASFASQGSRRGSATPLSPADRNFLLGFLENASNNAKG
ncbi:hypothetical protein GQX73_g3269 [Xylaria multiplex]|uniref:Nudix hydrolase domain-containing protein n=1 Tax=Xylaria multiplex TaxID=323545 RepID=A0A7C8IU41_9PEZI|nr:hypothetical protein GQX73_g3269 [Xylaria multiplex]